MKLERGQKYRLEKLQGTEDVPVDAIGVSEDGYLEFGSPIADELNGIRMGNGIQINKDHSASFGVFGIKADGTLRVKVDGSGRPKMEDFDTGDPITV